MNARAALPALARSVGLAMLASGCVLSVNPVVSESDATFDARLLGSWQEVSGSDRAVVTRGADNTYAIEYMTNGKVTRLGARLGRLGERAVLDVWPAPDSAPSELHAGFTIPGHLLVTLDAGAEEVRVAMIEPDTFAAALRSGRLQLEHAHTGGRPVLLGTTDELRAALAPYLMRPGALAPPGAWRRERPTAATSALRPVDVPCFEASAWREADRLFHRDPHWVGADVASTVDLGSGRILWLFGDTWVDTSGRATRRGARMISNSVAIQTGTDPATAVIKFYWGKAADGKPDALFPDRGKESLWFGNGVRIRDRLVLFFARTLRGVGEAAGGLGFEHIGWTAVMVENPDDEPSAWRVRPLETPANPVGILVGYADVLRLGDHVFALGSQNPVKSHPIYAARWLADDVRRGDLRRPEWWAGNRVGWIPDSSSLQRYPLFENGRSELSVHQDHVTQRFIAVQSLAFGPSDVMLRASPTLAGPWTAPRMVYRPPEYYRPHVAIYAAKGHPELTGADLVLTYVWSSFQFSDLFTDSLSYYPRFVRLTRCG